VTDPESPDKGRDMMNSNEVFDFDSYLESFKGNTITHEFMSRLVYTQCFSNLIEETFRLGLHTAENMHPTSVSEGGSATKS